MKCSIEWCPRDPRRKKGGMCSAHEQRSRAGRDMDAPFRETLRGANVPETCTLGDCAEPHYGKGMCKLHYERVYNGRPLDGPRRRNPRVPGVTRKRTKDGYILLWLPEHPAAFGPGWVFEHRAVMESHLGRYLLPGETVHHKYGDRADNRIGHLELWASTQPAGQRADDLAEAARRVLALYGTGDERERYREECPEIRPLDTALAMA